MVMKMITIVLFGDRHDAALLRMFERNLKQHFSVHTVTAGSLKKCGGGPNVLLINNGNPHTVCGEASIVVLKPDAELSRIRQFSREVVVLANSAYPEQLRQLSEMGLRTIVYGLSSKDTITFSSLGENTAAVSLQRTIEDLRGNPVEPLEVTVDFAVKCDPALVLLYVSALIISGACPRIQKDEHTLMFV